MKRVFSTAMVCLLCVSMFTIFAPKASGSNSPAGYWKFDESSGSIAHDSSGNGNDGTVVDASWTNGISKGALRFDGIDDYVSVPSSPSVCVTGNQITVQLWMKPAFALDASTPLTNILDKGNEYGFQMDARAPGRIWFFVWLLGAPWQGVLTTTNRWEANAWYLLTGTYDGNNLNVYVNGVLENSRTLSGDLYTFIFPLAIGSYCFGGMNFFNGVIDEVRIYNYARTAQDVLNDYNSVPQGPVGYWKFDEDGGTVAHDISGNGNDGTLHGPTWGSGILNGGLSFDGVDDYVDVPASPSLTPLPNGSLECWFKLAKNVTAGDGQAFYIISVPGAGGAYAGDWCVAIDSRDVVGINAGKLEAGIYDPGWPYDNGWHFVKSIQTYWVQDTWYHLAWTFGSEGQELYINGIRVSFDNYTGQASFDGYDDVLIGKDRSALISYQYFNGTIDEMKIYNYARTAEEVWSDYIRINGLSACMHLSANPALVLELPGQSSNIVATVVDQLGNQMPGVNVTFASSQGNLSSTSEFTDSTGEATVSLSPDNSTTGLVVASISAIANGVSANIEVVFYPSSGPPSTYWKTGASSFDIQSLSVNFSQYLLPFVESYNFLPFSQQISIDSINSLPLLNLYTITQSSSSNCTEFAKEVSQFFSISTLEGYEASGVLILEFPFLPIINALFHTTLEGPMAIPIPWLGGVEVLLNAQNITTTSSGNIVLAFSLSRIIDYRLGVTDFVTGVENFLVSLLKDDSKSAILNVANIINGIIEAYGDVSVSVITSDLSSIGQLSSYTLLDLAHVAGTISTLATMGGMVYKFLDIVTGGVEIMTTAGLQLRADVKTGFKIADLGLEVLPYLPDMSSLQDNWLYQLLSGSVSAITSVMDPNGTTIIPSFYNSTGSLVLGYDSASGNVNYASEDGILIPVSGDWLAFLSDNISSPVDYTAYLNSFGGNAMVPYNLRLTSSNMNATSIGYSGMVPNGTSTVVPISITPNGTLTEQVYLAPTLSVNETGNIFDFVATGMLSNGSQVPVDNAYLIINGSQYEMSRDNDSTFESQVDLNSFGLTQYSVYMLSSDIPGGFSTGFLRDEVAVASVTAAPTFVCQTYGCLTALNLTNTGDFAETLNVTIHANNTATGNVTVINRFENVTLDSRDSTMLAFMWDTTDFDLGNYTISAYATPVVGEINVADNTFVAGTVQIIQGMTGGGGGRMPYMN